MSSNSVISCLDDIEHEAFKILPRNALDYYRSGANQMISLRENRTAFQKLKLLPRMMIDVSSRNMKTSVLGTEISMPIGIAPTAMQKMAHPEGECAAAKAAEKAGTLFIMSTISTSSIEEVAQAAPNALKWFQLYIYKDRQVTAELVHRAERAGFKAIVLTVDAPYFGRRLADVKNKFKLPPHLRMANFVGLGDAETQKLLNTLAPLEFSKASFRTPIFFKVTAKLVHRAERAGFKAIVLTVDAQYSGRRLADIKNKFKLPPHLRMANFVSLSDAETQANKSEKGAEKSGSGINDYVTSLFDQTLTWKDITWLKTLTHLPIVVKGILHPEDALIAIDHGVSAIMVSNHGARQLDGVEATVDALPAIISAVQKQNANVEVYLDGGIRQGTDVIKALALGAKMVCIGRPVLWGLALSGQQGVELTLEILRKELDLAMALAGCTDSNNIDGKLVKTLRYSNL